MALPGMAMISASTCSDCRTVASASICAKRLCHSDGGREANGQSEGPDE